MSARLWLEGEELDSKLREGVQQDVDEKLQQSAHLELEKALVRALPDEFEVPETLVEQDAKQARARGT